MNDDFIVSTTGKASREVFEARESRNQGHGRDFQLLVVWDMHLNACGISIYYKKSLVF